MTSDTTTTGGRGPRSTIAKTALGKDKPAKPYEVRADRPSGLLLRVQPSGVRTYYVQVARRRRIRIGPAGTYTLRQAEDRARKILLDPDAADRKTRAGTTLHDYLDGPYRDHALARLKNGAQSIKRVKTVWKTLLAKPLTEISGTEVDRLRNKRILAGRAPATVNRDVAALSGVLAHWAENNKGTEHPLAGLSPLDVPDDETIRYLTPPEGKRLRAALRARDGKLAEARRSANEWRAARGYEPLPEIVGYADHVTPMVLISLNTGVRQGELFGLEWERIDLERKTISVIASNSKGKRTRTIPLNDEVVSVLSAIRSADGKGLVFPSSVTGEEFDNIRSSWKTVIKAADLSGFRWHDLRHDFASQLVMRGVPLYTVQKLLGHSNSRMTQRYARLAPDTLADAVKVLAGRR